MLAEGRQARADGRTADARQAELAAGRLMAGGALGGWVLGYFRRKGVREAEAEELAQDVWSKVIAGGYTVRSNALGLLHRIVISRLKDHIRQRRQGIDGWIVERPAGDEDDDEWSWLQSLSPPALQPSAELLDCVRRRFAEFERDNSDRAALLEMIALQLSYKEIAAALFDKDETAVTDADIGRVRDRIYRARKQAEDYFRDCQD
jgi:DNA-directed RNA polymerase specialized sigma24 family protein